MAAAARGVHQTPPPSRERRRTREAPPEAQVLSFETRDWQRLVDFAHVDICADTAAGDASRAEIPPEPPTKPSLGAPTNERPPRDASTTAVHARVLVVDDESEIREVVTAMLAAVGLLVETVASAEEALDALRRRQFDLVVLDWNLPGMTGVDLCRLMRKDDALVTTPVLFLTAHASSQDVVQAFASGADDYVAKPFRAPELGARVFGLLRRARMIVSAASS
jgi:two-component system phosphate regulon response regulator PhoB